MMPTKAQWLGAIVIIVTGLIFMNLMIRLAAATNLI